MLWDEISTFTHRFIDIASTILVPVPAFAILAVAWMRRRRPHPDQTDHPPKNFPVIGRFSLPFEHLGEFFASTSSPWTARLPFNRAQRIWVYRAAKNVDNTVALRLDRNIHERGNIVLFVNCPTRPRRGRCRASAADHRPYARQPTPPRASSISRA